jgi:hypothetical protein
MPRYLSAAFQPRICGLSILVESPKAYEPSFWRRRISGCRSQGQLAAAQDIASHTLAETSLAKVEEFAESNGATAASFESHLRTAAQECRKIVQRCLREEEWIDVDEAFVETLRRHFASYRDD